MAIAKIQTGDKVRVVSGGHKGIEGIVTKVVTVIRKNKTVVRRVAVSEVPTIVKYQKGNKAYDMPGSQKMVARMIDISNVMLVDSTGKVSRSSILIDEKTGKKTRVLNSDKSEVKKVVVPKTSKNNRLESKE